VTAVRVYLDYAATTPVDARVLARMLPYFDNRFGNPSSVHGFGQEGEAALDEHGGPSRRARLRAGDHLHQRRHRR
jgi:hypothetical protein